MHLLPRVSLTALLEVIGQGRVRSLQPFWVEKGQTSKGGQPLACLNLGHRLPSNLPFLSVNASKLQLGLNLSALEKPARGNESRLLVAR